MTAGETAALLAGLILLMLLQALKYWLEPRERPAPRWPVSSWSAVVVLGIATLISLAACLTLGGHAVYNVVRHVDLTRNLQQAEGVVERRWFAKGKGYVVAYRLGDRRAEDTLWRSDWRLAEPGRPITVYYSATRPDWHALDPWSFLTRALYALLWSIMCGVGAVVLGREHLWVAWRNVPGQVIDIERTRPL
ncbi:MAG: hypothetical protein ABL931_22575 [Usitatibacteraceae bacterium]